MLAGAEEQVASSPRDGMNEYLKERNLEFANMETLRAGGQTTNMLVERTVRPKDGSQPLTLFQPHSRQASSHRHGLLQDSQEAAAAAQRPQPTRRGNVLLQPTVENSYDHSEIIDSSTEYIHLAGDVNLELHEDIAGPVITQQGKAGRQRRPVQSSATSCDLMAVLNRQNEITSMLIKQQQLSLLPPKSIPVFDGDILQFRTFMSSFEHNIELKTDDAQDKLFYLEQYTKGQARELVRSCQHMDGNQGYLRAKRLLHEQFGNEYKISMAYIDKALSWPSIKPEDPKALKDFVLYLKGCCNSMERLDYMKELNVASNLKAIVMKLPYKLRDKWRTKAQERLESNSTITFTDLVEFIEKQSKICSNPIFGDIQDAISSRKVFGGSKSIARPKSSYAANVVTMSTPVTRCLNSNASKPKCLCCEGDHSVEFCSDLKGKTHRDKLNFLKEKGLCFGCLCKGHLSKDCKDRLSCNTCNRKHPTVLHINFEVKGETPRSVEQTKHIPTVSSNVCRHNGAGNSKCALSILPVQVKSVKGNKIIQTYAFLDPGSSTTFCTERLAQKLSLDGKPTTVLLRTLSYEKTIRSIMMSGLEVSELKSSKFMPIAEVYTQRSMPVTRDNIPTQEDLAEWPYLSEIQLPQIDSEVDLLIGMNAANVMEPWQVINSQGNGPYAVKTLLGWVINGPLGGCSKGVEMATATVYRISLVDLQQLLVSQYNTDFNEKAYEEKSELSINDKKFLNIANESVKVKEGHYCITIRSRYHHNAQQPYCCRTATVESGKEIPKRSKLSKGVHRVP